MTRKGTKQPITKRYLFLIELGHYNTYKCDLKNLDVLIKYIKLTNAYKSLIPEYENIRNTLNDKIAYLDSILDNLSNQDKEMLIDSYIKGFDTKDKKYIRNRVQTLGNLLDGLIDLKKL